MSNTSPRLVRHLVEILYDLARGVAGRWPAFSAYVMGPILMLGAAGFFVTYRPLFFFFLSEGSAAGLIVPIILWVILLNICAIGGLFLFGGLRALQNRGSSEQSAAVVPASAHTEQVTRSLPSLPRPAADALADGKALEAARILIDRRPELSLAQARAVIDAHLVSRPSVRDTFELRNKAGVQVIVLIVAAALILSAVVVVKVGLAPGKRQERVAPVITEAPPQAPSDPVVDPEKLRWLEHASPIDDFHADFEKGKYCFKQIKGLENQYPGTEAADHELVAAHSACVIADATVDEYQDLMGKAENYAKTYNSLALEVLRGSLSGQVDR